MKNRILTLLAAALTTAALLTATAPAHADAACNQRRVTPDEFAQLEPGVTTFAEARAITGGAGGIPMDDPAWVRQYQRMDRTWRVCSPSGWVLMSFNIVPGHGRQNSILSWADARWS